METTLRTIIDAVPAFNKLASGDLPLSLAYKLSKQIKALATEIAFFNAEREKVMEKYGGESRRDRIVFRDPGGVDEFEKVLELTVTPDTERLRIPMLDDIHLSAHDVAFLEPFVEFEVSE